MAHRTKPGPPTRTRGCLLALVVVAAAVGLFWYRRTLPPQPPAIAQSPAVSPGSPREPADPTQARLHQFVGAEACATCHKDQFDRWLDSTHGQAGGEPGEVPVIARFDGQPLRFNDAQVIPTTNNQGDYVFILDQPGQPRAEIRVDAIVGGGHMVGGGTQSFFHQFPDGTLRFLPFDFIREENVWFVQMRADKTWKRVHEGMSLREDLANWPPRRVLGTLVEFSNCQNCHGSQIHVRYDPAHQTYQTRYQSLRINCESCHGPGRRHIELVSRPDAHELEDLGMRALATLSKDQSLNVCFQCHADKDAIRDEPYLPGDNLEDFFSLKLPAFTDNPYRVDGRIRSFGYQLNHLFSDCYLNGSMSCVDCHDPHSLHYRDVNGQPLASRFDNRQCTSCHASKAVDPQRHTHHAEGSPGSLCVSCHMPYLQHAGVGGELKFARSDHTIPIPRPRLDQLLGIENACQKCHADQTLGWQEARVAEWYGEIKPRHPMVANLIQAEGINDLDAAAPLLLVPELDHPMAQSMGLAEFLRRFLRPAMPPTETDIAGRLRLLAEKSDADLAALALTALDVGYRERPEVRTLLEQTRSRETNGQLRARWAIATERLGSHYAEGGDLDGALLCFQKSVQIDPENIVSLASLAKVHLARGEPDPALEALLQAIRIKPYQAVLHFQRAQIHVQLGQVPQAIEALEEGLRFAPNDPVARAMIDQLRNSAIR